MADIFSTHGGLCFPVKLRRYGLQDKGVSPKGAQDQLSFITAYNLLDRPDNFQAVEMVYSGKISVERDSFVVICGASYETTRIDHNSLEYNQVHRVVTGQYIEFSGRKNGFRTIIMAVPFSEQLNYLNARRRSVELNDFINLNYQNNIIRVIKGPEYNILRDKELFNNPWSVSPNSSQMGILLEGHSLDTDKLEMISQPVADGTVQLSPGGPIVLMRHRQTVGGYPRIANVIEADISKLSQFAPGAKIRFKLVSIQDAWEEKRRLSQLLDIY